MGIQIWFHICKWRILLFNPQYHFVKNRARNVTRCWENVAQELLVSTHKSIPRLQLSNGYPNFISYLETKNFTFTPIIPLRSNSGLECDPKLRKCGRRTTSLRSQSRPCPQLSNGYPKFISYLEAKNFTFQPIIPLHSKSGMEYDQKLTKCGPRATHLRSQINTTSPTLKWVSKNDYIFGSEEFDFSTHNPTSFKRRLEMWPEVEKMHPKNYTSPLANQDHVSNSQMGTQSWFHIWKWRILLFNP